jgi:hypothetical protein
MSIARKEDKRRVALCINFPSVADTSKQFREVPSECFNFALNGFTSTLGARYLISTAAVNVHEPRRRAFATTAGMSQFSASASASASARIKTTWCEVISAGDKEGYSGSILEGAFSMTIIRRFVNHGNFTERFLELPYIAFLSLPYNCAWVLLLLQLCNRKCSCTVHKRSILLWRLIFRTF